MKTTTAIIGAGQCGLALSHSLTKRGVDHVVIERGQAGESWRSRPWQSLRLLTPNWMNALAGESYKGPDGDGFMRAADFAESFGDWVRSHQPPMMGNTQVQSLTRGPFGYRLNTDRGDIDARSVVVATGNCARSKRPDFANDLPREIVQVSPLDYQSPDALPEGGVLVVGAAASGLQIARELRLAGRDVTLAVGSHGRLPRRYRGQDILTWMSLAGLFEDDIETGDIERLRRLPSLPLIGHPTACDLDLNVLQDLGVNIVGRLAAIREGRALFSGGLANACASADLKMGRALDRIDAWIRDVLPFPVISGHRPAAARVPKAPRLTKELKDITTIVWATGFKPDHDFIDLPVFDRKGRLQHDGGIVGEGLYALGLPHLRTARSLHIDGAPLDAEALADDLTNRQLRQMAA